MKQLGKTDSVTSCDCCGKSDLKLTYAVELDDGEIVYYGSTCVTKHTGQTAVAIDRAADAAKLAEKEANEKRFNATFEAIQLVAKMAQAHKAGLIGRAFKDFCTAERIAADIKRAEIFI